MKTLLTFALLALIGLLHQNSAAPVGPGSLNESCCPGVTRSHVPRGKIQNIVRSHSHCPVTAIIVTTVRGRKFCLDGYWNWAKKVLTDFEKSPSETKLDQEIATLSV
ncbi:C-C motif chemokine 4 homolog [Sparus aurata]|uniref:C-C motif chemokine 4 homolog n=1 Tax=Sparus aurata TaxID=8175 RepID=A0A671X102_SPAAU|nr:C-C motif chemokine 4 homolog [Sparus aurata]XP_030270882.1 C-C motif chemokine 4 homolog [Sparus aurata]